MGVGDMLGGLFSSKRMAKAPELSPYTIDHSNVDEYIHDELRDKSKHFRHALERCPELEIEVEDADGNIDVQSKRVDAAAGLNSDMFFAFHDKRDAPRTMAPEQVKPSRELFRQVMQGMIDTDDFKSARAQTRGDEVGSAFAMMAAADEMDKALTGVLKDHLERAQKMDEQEQTLGGGPPEPLPTDPDDRWKALQDYAAKRRQARGTLDELAQEQAASGLGSDVAQAIGGMAEKAEEAAEAWSNLPGNGTDRSRHSMDPDAAIEMARKWIADPTAAEVAALMGRFQRDFRYKHTNRTVGGNEVPVDVEFGNDLSKILASEMMMLAMPQMRAIAAEKFVSKTMLQYEMVGSDDAGKGPFVMIVDFSGSMSGEREIWAKAVALSMLAIAQRERREVVILGFHVGLIGEWHFGRNPDLNQAFDFASTAADGGDTRPFEATERAEQILTSVASFRQADIVLVTDGEARFTQADLDIKERVEAKGVRIFGISIDCGVTRYLGAMCTHVMPVTDLQSPSEATDMLVEAI